LLASHTHTLEVVGVITKGGDWAPAIGEEITASTILNGRHVKAKLQTLLNKWDTYQVTPSSPVRVFANDVIN